MGGIADWLGIGKTISDTAANLTAGAADIVTAAKTDPNKHLDTELKKLQVAAGVEIEKITQETLKAARNWSLQYEGKASEIQPWLRVVRNLIRPAFSLYFLGLLVTVTGIDLVRYIQGGGAWELTTGLPQGVWWLAGIVLTFWFGGKVGERIAEQIKKP